MVLVGWDYIPWRFCLNIAEDRFRTPVRLLLRPPSCVLHGQACPLLIDSHSAIARRSAAGSVKLCICQTNRTAAALFCERFTGCERGLGRGGEGGRDTVDSIDTSEGFDEMCLSYVQLRIVLKVRWEDASLCDVLCFGCCQKQPLRTEKSS